MTVHAAFDRGAKEPPIAPPHDIQLEQALLGAVLVNNDAFSHVKGFLKPEHFYEPIHRKLYEIAATLVGDGKAATPLTLRTFLPPDLDVAGLTASQYLARLAAEATTVINASGYGRMIADLAARRSLIELSEDMIAAARRPAPDQPVHALMAQVTTALNELATSTSFDAPKRNKFNPQPYQFPDPAKIPRRAWLDPRKHYMRGVVGASIGAPGRLKSTTELTEFIGMSVGRDLFTGKPLECGALRVAYLNGEENQVELDRWVAAICKRYSLKREDCGDRLWVISTRDTPIRLAVPGPGGAAVVAQEVVDELLTWCDACQIDVLSVDPLISFHRVRENDSGDMDTLCKEAFGRIAGEIRSVDLVGHTRKSGPGEINTTVDDWRGASSQLGAVRIARTFNFMTTAEAIQLGVEEKDRRLHVRIDDGKSNPGPTGAANWVKIQVENLPNGDVIAVATLWVPPDPFQNVSAADMKVARELAQTGEYRADVRSPQWFGWRLAQHLKVQIRYGGANSKLDMARVKAIIKTWLQNNVLEEEDREDENRKKRKYIIAGSFRLEPDASTVPVHEHEDDLA